MFYYEGDIVRQTERLWENISVLLQEGGASFIDVASMIIYLRDVSDR
jgi:enamine deaminase RidA (YjgF/YER057c/UK114 family)